MFEPVDPDNPQDVEAAKVANDIVKLQPTPPWWMPRLVNTSGGHFRIDEFPNATREWRKIAKRNG